MPARTINLRRAPVLHADDTPFVSQRIALEQIDRHWQHLCTENPAYFDGQLWHVINVHRNGHGGATLHVQPGAYRNWAVQHAFNLDVGILPLGVKGLICRDGRVLIGRRGPEVAAYADAWEFAPGGVVELDQTPAQTIAAELSEETTLSITREPVAVAIILDDVVRTWEIIHRIDAPAGEPQPTDEYPELRWIDPAEDSHLPDDLTPLARAMLPLARATTRR